MFKCLLPVMVMEEDPVCLRQEMVMGVCGKGIKKRTLYVDWVLLASVLLKAASDRNLN